MKKFCRFCDGELLRKKWYTLCKGCNKIIPESLENVWDEINDMLLLLDERVDYLNKLEQKHLSCSKELMGFEKTELELWTKHHYCYIELDHYLSKHDKTDKGREKIYELLYEYVKIADEIKRFYQK